MKSSVHNQKLKKQMELLTKRALVLYDSIFTQNTVKQNFSEIFILIDQQDKIKSFDEYTKCKDLVIADTKISDLLGKLVGSTMGMSVVEDADTSILQFIQQVYLVSKNKLLDSSTFDEHYSSFEELFYNDRLRFIDTVRLYNFESEEEEIFLEKGLVIKKLPHLQDGQAKMEELKYRPYAGFSKSEFVIERKYTALKRVGNFKPSSEQIIAEMNESGDVFDLVVKALRILRRSAIYRENGVITKQLTFNPHAGVTSRFSFFEKPVMGTKCTLSRQDAGEIKTIFTKMKQEKNPFIIASNRLGFGMERRSDEDKLLDYMIGLESLYLPDGQDELTFRLSLRVSFTLQQEMTVRKSDFDFLKKMYGVRSKIAHGKEYNLTTDDIIKLEEKLRQSLKLYLTSPSKFSKENLDNAYFE